jgi:fatty acid amide hydrolase
VGSEGLPIGVQVIARPWREDVALVLMAVLESASRERLDFPKTPVETF